ncbi:hypothetical protein HA397_28020 [Escherichia coli]|nr:hypothetical protein [Escherichia coli]
MTAMVLTKTQIRAGVWNGVLEVTPAETTAPLIEVVHQDRPLDQYTLTPDTAQPGRYHLAVPIPADLLNDGVQTFVIRAPGSGATLAHFTIVTGEPLEDDIRAEMDLLRAELDMLKRAFRRHCLETM